MHGKMFRFRWVHVLLCVLTLRLVLVCSERQNLPGYLGCFGDSYDRALPDLSESSSDQSVDRCFLRCLQPDQYKYAGLEYGEECFCGNNEDYNRYGKEPDSDCSYECTGNSDQICGYRWRLSIYRISDGVCSNDIGPPTNGARTVTNPRSLPDNIDNFKFFGTRVSFSCDPGYILRGEPSIECIQTGYNNVTWSDAVPTCEVLTTTTESTTLEPTTTEGATTESPVTRGKSTTHRAPSSTDHISGVPGDNDPQTGTLQTGVIVAIAVGAGILVALILLVILLCKKRRKQKQMSPDVPMATLGDDYTNNTYALPDIVSQPTSDQSTTPVYSQVIKNKPDSDDVYANPDDVTGRGNAPSNQSNGVTQSPDQGQESGWVENTLYACESFPAQETRYRDGQTDSGPQPTLESGWVENTIYE